VGNRRDAARSGVIDIGPEEIEFDVGAATEQAIGATPERQFDIGDRTALPEEVENDAILALRIEIDEASPATQVEDTAAIVVSNAQFDIGNGAVFAEEIDDDAVIPAGIEIDDPVIAQQATAI